MSAGNVRGIKKAAIAAAAALSAFALSGCGASLTVSEYTENGKRVNVFELSIDDDTVRKMEDTAAADASTGAKYTVPEYFYELLSSPGFDCELVDANRTPEAYTAVYRKTYDGATDLETFGAKLEFMTTYTQNPFVRKYDSVAENPFNGVRAKYDAVLPNESTTIIQRLKNGVKTVDEYGEISVLFPSVTDAFPYLKDVDPSGLLLEYAYTGSRRMKSSGTAVKLDRKNNAYVFGRYFDTIDTTIEFEYNRPVPYGWYVTALAAGGLTIAAIALATRKKKDKPTLLDRFPYNPEQYRDYDSHLPM